MILICLRFICSNYYIKILNYICEKCPMCLTGNIKRVADVIFFTQVFMTLVCLIVRSGRYRLSKECLGVVKACRSMPMENTHSSFE